MSVLITGMEMPKDGSWVTLRVFPDGQCFLYSWCGNDFDFMEHLTAVPVPPHGRLIDADVFLDDLLFPSKQFEQGMRELVADAPTIIEAENYSERELQRDYEASVEYAQHCGRYEPTYDPETGAM